MKVCRIEYPYPAGETYVVQFIDAAGKQRGRAIILTDILTDFVAENSVHALKDLVAIAEKAGHRISYAEIGEDVINAFVSAVMDRNYTETQRLGAIVKESFIARPTPVAV